MSSNLTVSAGNPPNFGGFFFYRQPTKSYISKTDEITPPEMDHFILQLACGGRHHCLQLVEKRKERCHREDPLYTETIYGDSYPYVGLDGFISRIRYFDRSGRLEKQQEISRGIVSSDEWVRVITTEKFSYDPEGRLICTDTEEKVQTELDIMALFDWDRFTPFCTYKRSCFLYNRAGQLVTEVRFSSAYRGKMYVAEISWSPGGRKKEKTVRDEINRWAEEYPEFTDAYYTIYYTDDSLNEAAYVIRDGRNYGRPDTLLSLSYFREAGKMIGRSRRSPGEKSRHYEVWAFDAAGHVKSAFSVYANTYATTTDWHVIKKKEYTYDSHGRLVRETEVVPQNTVHVSTDPGGFLEMRALFLSRSGSETTTAQYTYGSNDSLSQKQEYDTEQGMKTKTVYSYEYY